MLYINNLTKQKKILEFTYSANPTSKLYSLRTVKLPFL